MKWIDRSAAVAIVALVAQGTINLSKDVDDILIIDRFEVARSSSEWRSPKVDLDYEVTRTTHVIVSHEVRVLANDEVRCAAIEERILRKGVTNQVPVTLDRFFPGDCDLGLGRFYYQIEVFLPKLGDRLLRNSNAFQVVRE